VAGTKTAGDNPDGVWLTPQTSQSGRHVVSKRQQCRWVKQWVFEKLWL